MARKTIPVRKQLKAVKKKHAKPRETEITDDELADEITKVTASAIRKRPRAEKVDVATRELKNVIADTMERLGYGSERDDARVNNEEYWGHNIVLAMKYGVRDDGRLASLEPDVAIIEHEYDEIPYCKEHR